MNKPLLPIDVPLQEQDLQLMRWGNHHLQPVETLHENKWFSVKNRGGYYTSECRHIPVCVLPVVEQNAILLVRVKRPVINDNTLELPGGHIKSGETLLQTAARELQEETGITVTDFSRFNHMPPLSISPSREPKLYHAFQINLTDQEFQQRQKHDNEIEEVNCYSMDKLMHMIATGQIYIPWSIAIIAMYLFSKNYIHGE